MAQQQQNRPPPLQTGAMLPPKPKNTKSSVSSSSARSPFLSSGSVSTKAATRHRLPWWLAWRPKGTASVAYVYGAAVALRIALLRVAPGLVSACRSSVFLSTPLTSWEQITEGIFLYRRELPLYQDNVFVQSTLLLPVLASLPSATIPALFTALDIATAHAIQDIASNVAKIESSFAPSSPPGWVLAALHLLNPFTVATFLAQDIGVIERACTCIALAAAARGDTVLSSVAICIATHLGVYPVLMIPCLGIVHAAAVREPVIPSMFAITLSYIMWHIILYVFIEHVMGFSFFNAFGTTISASLTSRFLVPNVGMHWYFFVQMFESFRSLFAVVFFGLLAAYLPPILLRFGNEMPVFASIVYYGIITSMRSYPTYGEHAFWLALLAIYYHLQRDLRAGRVISIAYIFCLVFFPVTLVAWAVDGIGNANYLFGFNVTLLSACALLQMDVMVAAQRRVHRNWILKSDELVKSKLTIVSPTTDEDGAKGDVAAAVKGTRKLKLARADSDFDSNSRSSGTASESDSEGDPESESESEATVRIFSPILFQKTKPASSSLASFFGAFRKAKAKEQ